jgi:sphinganine-1-phosphate aldolase
MLSEGARDPRRAGGSGRLPGDGGGDRSAARHRGRRCLPRHPVGSDRTGHIQPQLSFEGSEPTIHLSLSAATADHVEEFLAALTAGVAGAVAAGPIVIDPGIVDFVTSLDAATLSDDDFDDLLAAVGMAGGDGSDVVGLPESLAEINALLDLATPALREALLSAFLDRLQRPVR